MSIWIGPAGSLLQIAPEARNPPQVPEQRIGGEHVGLTGKRTTDVWGYRHSWTLAWDVLSEDELAWLAAAARGDLGRLYLVDERWPNLLPLRPPRWAPYAPAGPALLGPAGLDVGCVLPAAGGTFRTALVPVLTAPGYGPNPVTASLFTATPGVTVAMQALGADRTVLASTPAYVKGTTGGEVVSRTTWDLPGGTIPAGTTFWAMQVVAPAVAGGTPVSEAQIRFGTAVRRFAPRGGSARVQLDDFVPSEGYPPWYGANVNAQEV